MQEPLDLEPDRSSSFARTVKNQIERYALTEEAKTGRNSELQHFKQPTGFYIEFDSSSHMSEGLESQGALTASQISKPPKSRKWLVYAFASCLFYSLFNYITGAYNKDAIAGKVINSMVLGATAIVYWVVSIIRRSRKQPQRSRLTSAESEFLQANDLLSAQRLSVQLKNELSHTRQTQIASSVALVCGFLSFIANFLVFYASELATQNHQNIGIVTAITNGAVLFALAGSRFIYKEHINGWQVLGSFMSFGGILLLSLSTLNNNDGGKSGAVIKVSLISLCFYGSRLLLIKFSSKVLSSAEFAKLNFLGDFTLGMLILILGATGAMRGFTITPDALLLNTLNGLLCLGAEFSLILAIEEGYTGPVVAVVSFCAILTSLLTWTITGVALLPLQILGVCVSFTGVVTISLNSKGD